jgi:CARDB
MGIIRHITKKIFSQAKSSHQPSLKLEALESRVLLNSDLSGLWTLSGYDMEMSDNYPNDPDISYAPMYRVLAMSESLDGGYSVQVYGEPEPFEFVDISDGLDYNLLSYSEEGYDDGNYRQMKMIAVEVSDNVILLAGAEGGYDSEAMVEIYWTSGWFGIMTQGAYTPTQRPWQGQYSVMEYGINVNDSYDDGYEPGVSWEFEDSMFIEVVEEGVGQYMVQEIGNTDPDEEWGYLQVGNHLENHEEYVDGYDYEVEHEYIYRGPDDTMLVVGGCAGYATGNGALWGGEFWAVIAYPQQGYEYKPDLEGTIDSDSLPDMTLPEGTFTVPVTVANTGNAPALGMIDIDLYASEDQSLDGTDTPLTTVSRYVYLPAGSSQIYNLRVQLPDEQGISVGDYYLLADIDSQDNIAEINEDNVVASDQTFGVAEPQTDLSGQIDLGNLTASMGGDRELIFLEITNDGNITVNESIDVDFYLSTDTVLDDGDTPVDALFDKHRPYLLPNKSVRLVNFVTLPTGLDTGDYYLLADIAQATDEQNISNNVAVSSALTVEKAYVDLTGTVDLRNWTSAVGGDRGLVFVNVTNEGNATAQGKVDIGLYLSEDENYDENDILVEQLTDQTVYLMPGMTRPFYRFLTLPEVESSGDYHLLAKIEPEETLYDDDLTNNVVVSDTTIQVAPPFVDLTVQIDTRNWTSGLEGDRGLVFVNVTNDGNVTANGKADLQIYLSEDEALDEGDTSIAEMTDQFVYLWPGMTRPFFSFLTLPEVEATGDYYLLAEITPEASLNDVTNNISSGTAIEVQKAFVDLTAEFQLVTFQDQVSEGNYGLVMLTVNNGGNVRATGTMDIELWASADGDLDAGDDDYLLKTLSDQRLFVGTTFPQYFVSLVIWPDLQTVPADTYWLVAKVDALGEIDESDETNNLALSTQTYIVA